MNLQGRNSYHGKSWKAVTSQTRRKAPAPPHDLKLQNGLIALTANEELGVPSNGVSPAADAEPLSHLEPLKGSDKWAWLETSYCKGQKFPSADLVCCFLGAQIWDIVEKLPRLALLHPLGPTALPHRCQRYWQVWLKGTGAAIKGIEMELVFSLILPPRRSIWGRPSGSCVLSTSFAAAVGSRASVCMTLEPSLRVHSYLWDRI